MFISAPNHPVMWYVLAGVSVSVAYVNVSLAEPTLHRSTVEHTVIVMTTLAVSITTRCVEVTIFPSTVKTPKNFNVDFSKYLLIGNELETHWIQRIRPICDLF